MSKGKPLHTVRERRFTASFDGYVYYEGYVWERPDGTHCAQILCRGESRTRRGAIENAICDAEGGDFYRDVTICVEKEEKK